MILVEEQDQDVLRFPRVNDINEDEVKIQPQRFTSVIFGVVPGSNSTIRHHH